MVRIGVPRETAPRERRVAATPETVKKLASIGSVVVEEGAGIAADIPDAAWAPAGASIGDPWSAELVLKVAPPSLAEVAKLSDGAVLVSHADPTDRPDVVAALAAKRISWAALERVPRISRAQKMDVLSSMATLAGYRSVLEAANTGGRFFPMMMSAAGTLTPVQVLVIGAGVAGLSALATAKRLGAVCRAFDTRPAVKDQVKSVGARFLELELDASAEDAGGYAKAVSAEFLAKEHALLAKHCAEVDVVITTALVAGREAPKLIDDAMVAAMKPGSVIVDLAAPRGGNCTATRPDEVVQTANGVWIVGPTDLPSRMAADASRLFARNVRELVLHFRGKATDGLNLDPEDEIIKATFVMLGGQTERGGASG